MDDEPCRQFFLQPHESLHRRYEALRAYFIDGLSVAEIAERLGYRLSSLKSMVCRFRASCAHGTSPPFFFRTDADAPTVGGAAKITTGRTDRTSPIADSYG
jgi:Sigma-70, region 4